MDIFKSIKRAYKEIFPTTWKEREMNYQRHLEKVWGTKEGQIEKEGKESQEKLKKKIKSFFGFH